MNGRPPRLFSHNGESRSLSEWSIVSGISRRNIQARIDRGWSMDRVLNERVFVGHGGRRSREYGIWANMKQRCLNARNPAYRFYGGRGITICEKWLLFPGFLEDMGRCPSPACTIE